MSGKMLPVGKTGREEIRNLLYLRDGRGNSCELITIQNNFFKKSVSCKHCLLDIHTVNHVFIQSTFINHILLPGIALHAGATDTT